MFEICISKDLSIIELKFLKISWQIKDTTGILKIILVSKNTLRWFSEQLKLKLVSEIWPYMMVISFSLKSMEVYFPESSDQFELKSDVLCSITPVLAQIILLIPRMIMPEDLLDWNMLLSKMVSCQQPTLILFGFRKYFHLRVVDVCWPIIPVILSNFYLLLSFWLYFWLKILPNHLPNLNQYFIKCLETHILNLDSNKILATLLRLLFYSFCPAARSLTSGSVWQFKQPVVCVWVFS